MSSDPPAPIKKLKHKSLVTNLTSDAVGIANPQKFGICSTSKVLQRLTRHTWATLSWLSPHPPPPLDKKGRINGISLYFASNKQFYWHRASCRACFFIPDYQFRQIVISCFQQLIKHQIRNGLGWVLPHGMLRWVPTHWNQFIVDKLNIVAKRSNGNSSCWRLKFKVFLNGPFPASSSLFFLFNSKQ